MQILVKTSYPSEQNVSVTVEDFCNHFGAEEKIIAFADPIYSSDSHRFEPTGTSEEVHLYCDNCKSYQDYDGYWVEDTCA